MAAAAEGTAILHGRAAAEALGDTPEVDLVLAAPGALAVRVDLEARVALEALEEAALMAALGRIMAEDEEEATVSPHLVEAHHHQAAIQAEEVMVRQASGRKGLIGAGPTPRCWRS